MMELTSFILNLQGQIPATLEESYDVRPPSFVQSLRFLCPQYIAQRNRFRERFASYWQASGVDVVLSPVQPTPGSLHGTCKFINVSARHSLRGLEVF